ncbi:MAG: DUF4870 domain-containing protein [Nitrospiraceae bacterium]|nr:DUF4870 domain-containing protein [Nitrospiraceae bacterium]
MSRSHRDLFRLESDNSIAGVNYISCLIGGWIFSLIMVLVSQKRSEYARFHAIQCLAYHIVIMAISMLASFASMPLMLRFMREWIQEMNSMASSGPPDPMAMWGMMFDMYAAMWPLWVLSGVFMLLNLTIAIVGMVQAFRCKDFAIPVIGPVVMKWFFKEAPVTVAAVG